MLAKLPKRQTEIVALWVDGDLILPGMPEDAAMLDEGLK